MTAKAKISAQARRTWKRLIGFYGARFAEQYGDTPSEDWCAVIDRMDTIELERTLSIVRSEHLQHPPALGELEAIANRHRRPQTAGGPSVAEQLHDFVRGHRALCRHQRAAVSTYIGRIERNAWIAKGAKNPVDLYEPTGVIVPACSAEHCPEGRPPGYRVTVEDMRLEEATGQAALV